MSLITVFLKLCFSGKLCMKGFTFDLDFERGITTMEMIMIVFLFQHIYTDSHICTIKKYLHQILSQS